MACGLRWACRLLDWRVRYYLRALAVTWGGCSCPQQASRHAGQTSGGPYRCCWTPAIAPAGSTQHLLLLLLVLVLLLMPGPSQASRHA